MNNRKIHVFILAILLLVSILASQVGSVGASCIRNCPWDGAIAATQPADK